MPSGPALNDLGARVVKAEKQNLKNKFPTATPFTMNSIGMQRARKSNMQVVIYMRDIAAGYMQPYELGGVHKLNSRALLNPKDINVNQYGNLPRATSLRCAATRTCRIAATCWKGRTNDWAVCGSIPASKGKPGGVKS